LGYQVGGHKIHIDHVMNAIKVGLLERGGVGDSCIVDDGVQAAVAKRLPDFGNRIPDPAAFELYATGEWTIERLAGELAHRGLQSQGRDRTVGPIGVSALATILSNKAYAGIVCWDGIKYPGLHEPLIDTTTFHRVQDLVASRSARGTRERRHNHDLKGTMVCGVCGRGLSVQLSKGRYEYLYCLGQKNRSPTGCKEPYIAAGDLEAQVEALYSAMPGPSTSPSSRQNKRASHPTPGTPKNDLPPSMDSSPSGR
jgi:hypothetical protein